jgi:rsbT co-antagonist protein RsbR
MKPDLQRLSSFWRDQSDTFIEKLCDDVAAHAGPAYLTMPREELYASLTQTVQAWYSSLDANDPAPLVDYIHKLSLERVTAGIDINEVMGVIDIIRVHIWRMMSELYASGDWDMDVVEHVEAWLHEERKAIMQSYSKHFEDASDRLAERERAIEAQSRLIQELSAPIVPIHKGVLVLPLVGTIDSRRASQIMESALEKIVAFQADVLILDITGVPLVDTGVANYILQMARAVTLLGSKVVLVGIGAEIAQTIVQLGVELNDMTTLANLQAGIAFALAEQGFAIRPIGAAGRDLSAA